MAGKFNYKRFAEINLNDPFFSSLKDEYQGAGESPDFISWFRAHPDRRALVFEDEVGIGALICLKDETEPIELAEGGRLPCIQRLKISTFKIAERFRGQRIGEGAIGEILWLWQKLGRDEVYVTVFENHTDLIFLLDKFGFEMVGHNADGECIYVHNRHRLDYSDPYKCFPFINPNYDCARYLIVNDYYHDTMFPYSELKNTRQEKVDMKVANGLSKVYISKAASVYKPGDLVLIYRRHTQPEGQARYKSCVTSYGIVTNVTAVKSYGRVRMEFNDAMRLIGNKSVYSEEEIRTMYDNDTNLIVLDLLYCGFFGEGNNVNNARLLDMGFWPNGYPTSRKLTLDEFCAILREGNVDVSNAIID